MDLKRSWMFVPGSKQKMLDKALGLPNLDCMMMDLEDGVAPQDKDLAREQIGKTLERVAGQGEGVRTPMRFVRLSATAHTHMYRDLDQVLRPGLQGLVLPKTEDPYQVKMVEKILDEREQKAGLKPGSVSLLVAIESPNALFNGLNIVKASKRVIGMMFGAEDFGKEMGLPTNREGEAAEMLFARSQFAMIAAAAQIMSVDGVWPNYQDAEGHRRFALQARRLGFSSMSTFHPAQIDAINEIFSPTAAEVKFCQEVIKAFDEAMARGDGAIAMGGQLIDLPIVDRARRTLDLAKQLKL